MIFMTKMFKSFMAMLLVLALIFALAGCSSSPSEASFKKAYEKEVEAVVKSIDEYYALADGYDYKNIAVDGNVRFTLSDSLLTLLLAFTSYDWSWINDLKIHTSQNTKDNMTAVSVGLDYTDNNLIAMDMIMDPVSNRMFMGIPALNDAFFAIDLSSEEAGDLNLLAASYLGKNELPAKEPIQNVIRDVLATVLEGIQEVTFAEETLVVNGVEQACVAYEVRMTTAEAAQILTNVLEMLKADEDVKTLVCDLAQAFIDSSAYSVYEAAGGGDAQSLPNTSNMAEDAYAVMIEAIDDMLLELESLDTAGEIVWTSYITSKLDILGVKVEFLNENEEPAVFYMAGATNKNEIGETICFQMDGTTYFGLEGNFTNDGKLLSGTYELTVDDKSMAFIEVENFDVNAKQGLGTGSITVAPAKGLLDLIEENYDVDLSPLGLTLANLSVKIDVTTSEKNASAVSVSLMNGEQPYVSLSIDASFSDSKAVTLPEKTTEDGNEWISGLDLNKFVDAVKDSGLPEYVVELIGLLG